MNRTTRLLGLLLAGAVALASVAGCGRLSDRETATELSWDAQALESIGYPALDLVAAEDSGVQNETPGPRMRHPRLRYLFQHALHGEATVQTEEGLKTVVVQRGEVTEVTGSTVTVRSSDGFTLTWQLIDGTVVVVDRTRSEIGDVPVGTEVGVAGAREGDGVDARLVVVPRR
jgi:hypothetical protein